MELLLLGFTILSYMTYRVKEIPYLPNYATNDLRLKSLLFDGMLN